MAENPSSTSSTSTPESVETAAVGPIPGHVSVEALRNFQLKMASGFIQWRGMQDESTSEEEEDRAKLITDFMKYSVENFSDVCQDFEIMMQSTHGVEDFKDVPTESIEHIITQGYKMFLEYLAPEKPEPMDAEDFIKLEKLLDEMKGYFAEAMEAFSKTYGIPPERVTKVDELLSEIQADFLEKQKMQMMISSRT